MYKLNKIRGHIKMQEFQELKLIRFLAEENAMDVPNPNRLKDIERALRRVQENIKMWREKLATFENMEPRPPSRPAVNDGPDRPLIG